MFKWKDKLINVEDKKKLLTNSGAYFLLGLSVIAMTFFGICQPKYEGFTVSGVAAKIGSEKVSPQEFRRAFDSARDRMQQQYQEAFDPILMQLPKHVMRQLVDERISYNAALELGIEGQEEDVVRLLQDAKAFRTQEGKFDGEAFERYLRSNGYTEASFSSEIRRSVGVQNYRQFIGKSVYVSKVAAALQHRLSETKLDVEFLKIEPSMIKTVVSDEEVKKFLDEPGKAKVKVYFDGHQSEFNTSEKVKARHILVSYTGAKNAAGEGALRSKEAAKKKAEDVLKQVKAQGADFAKLASALTDEASGKARGGDLGLFSRQDMVKEFSDAAFAMKSGDISGVIESPFGFHVIKVESKVEAKTVSLEQATNDIATKLIKEEKAAKLLTENSDKLLAAIKAGTSIDADLKDLGAKWEATGPMSVSSSSFGAIGSDRANLDEILKLKNPGDVAGRVLDNRGSKFIVKLKSRIVLDDSKIDDVKRKELAETAANGSGYSLLQAYERTLKKELETKGRIWENPEYLTLGQREAGANSSGG
ncbi:MAG: peptidylprolyl isomerase [Proteobacteria bacterium]|nr:peptidylprolyl isomerase [Pseudomonadota bacterium]